MLDVSDGACRMLGYQREELIGADPAGFGLATHAQMASHASPWRASGRQSELVETELAGVDMAVPTEVRWQLDHLTAPTRSALQQLHLLGQDQAGPLGSGLLATGILADVIRRIQTDVAARRPTRSNDERAGVPTLPSRPPGERPCAVPDRNTL